MRGTSRCPLDSELAGFQDPVPSQPASQPASQPDSQPASQTTSQPLGQTNRRTDRRTDRRIGTGGRGPRSQLQVGVLESRARPI